jgi:ATP-dependent DNA helicase Q4
MKVRQAYKMYYRMKTTFLSNTLTDALDDDDEFSVDSFNVSQINSTESLTPAISDLMDPRFSLPEIAKDTSPVETDKFKDFSREFEAVDQLTTNEKAWNDKLNKPKPTEKSIQTEKPLAFKKKLSLNIEPVMIKPMRNPKKSLSKMKTFSAGSSSKVNDESPKEALPDLETILLEKSRGRNLPEAKPVVNVISEIKTSLDIGWLDRNTSSTSDGYIAKTSSVLSAASSFGLSNLNMKSFTDLNLSVVSSMDAEVKFDAPIESESEIVENSDDEEVQLRRPFLHIAKKRRLSGEKESVVNTQITEQSDRPFSAPAELSFKGPQKPTRQSIRRPYVSNNEMEKIDEELITTNDEKTDFTDEAAAQNSKTSPPVMKRKRSLIKRSKDGLSQIAKKASKILSGGKKTDKDSEGEEIKPEEEINFLIDSDLTAMKTVPRASQKELKTTEKLFDNYLRQNDTTAIANKTGTLVDSKTAAKKEALEKKIASGTLNDNYVRVNLKKKVFVRGKKAFSFSKYKKGIWKSKKAAALSGPEMDMRGCDGGVLKCYNCDGIGHFAQNCKQKGDSLLPIDADVKDESPFPTLEEAAEMANDQKLLVHCKNPDQLPSTSNQVWKKLDQLCDEEGEEVLETEEKVSNKENQDHNIESIDLPVQETQPNQVNFFNYVLLHLKVNYKTFFPEILWS